MTDELKTEDVKTEITIGGSDQHPVNKKGASGAIEKAGDVFSTIMKAVSEGVSSAAKGTGKAGVSVVEAVGSVVRATVRESLGAGGDFLVGSKAVVMGVIRGTCEKEELALNTLSHTARTVIRQTAEMNGDVGAAATGLVLGAIAGAEYMRVTPSKAASAVRTAAIKEGDRNGLVAAEKVRTALRKDIGGINFGSTELFVM